MGVAGRYLPANCGSMEGLGRCSRCHGAWFCSVKCQKAYWPFHREWCKKNDFADALEAEQPKFAKWMRKHGKVAVLKDGASVHTHRLFGAPVERVARRRPLSTRPMLTQAKAHRVFPM